MIELSVKKTEMTILDASSNNRATSNWNKKKNYHLNPVFPSLLSLCLPLSPFQNYEQHKWKWIAKMTNFNNSNSTFYRILNSQLIWSLASSHFKWQTEQMFKLSDMGKEKEMLSVKICRKLLQFTEQTNSY